MGGSHVTNGPLLPVRQIPECGVWGNLGEETYGTSSVSAFLRKQLEKHPQMTISAVTIWLGFPLSHCNQWEVGERKHSTDSIS